MLSHFDNHRKEANIIGYGRKIFNHKGGGKDASG